MSTISQLIAEIAIEREKIWREAPPELERLKSQQRGRAGNLTVRLYAFADAYRNQRNIWLLRDGVKTQRLTIEVAKSVLAPFLGEMADRFEIWSLSTPAQLFRKASSLLDQVQTPDELTDLLDELLIYNNRWWFWLDGCIPWFDLDRELSIGL